MLDPAPQMMPYVKKRTDTLFTKDESKQPMIHRTAPVIATILQPQRSQREVVSGPKKNIIPVASEPIHAKQRKGSIKSIKIDCYNYCLHTFRIVSEFFR